MEGSVFTVNDEMKQAAEYAIKVAKEKFGLILDYSDNSLPNLEKLLEQASQQYRSQVGNRKPLDNAINRTASIWGSYLGEVIRRKWGGEWIIDENSKRLLSINGLAFFPILYIYQRITGQQQKNVKQYLEQIAAKLSPEPTNLVQSMSNRAEIAAKPSPQPTNLIKPKSNRKWIYTALGISSVCVILFMGVLFIRSENRNKRFNSELQRTISENADPSKDIYSVGGSYGTIITNTELTDNFFESTDGLSESDKLMYQNAIVMLNELNCLSYRIERLNLITEYLKDKTYPYDIRFINSQYGILTCKIQTTKNLYVLSFDNNGERGITINGALYTSSDISPSDIYGYGNSSQALRELMSKNNADLTAKDVQYDMKNDVGKNFGLEGTAEICDYYNWGYDSSIESEYFCMEVTPNGGTYDEHWYIYSDRVSFDELYQDLLGGQVSIQMIGCIDPRYFEENQQNQATLISAQWWK